VAGVKKAEKPVSSDEGNDAQKNGDGASAANQRRQRRNGR